MLTIGDASKRYGVTDNVLYWAVRKGLLRPAGVTRKPGTMELKTYRAEDIERVLAERQRAVAEQDARRAERRKRDAARVRDTFQLIDVDSFVYVPLEDRLPEPVLYGLLTEDDVRELERRKSLRRAG